MLFNMPYAILSFSADIVILDWRMTFSLIGCVCHRHAFDPYANFIDWMRMLKPCFWYVCHYHDLDSYAIVMPWKRMLNISAYSPLNMWYFRAEFVYAITILTSLDICHYNTHFTWHMYMPFSLHLPYAITILTSLGICHYHSHFTFSYVITILTSGICHYHTYTWYCVTLLDHFPN